MRARVNLLGTRRSRVDFDDLVGVLDHSEASRVGHVVLHDDFPVGVHVAEAAVGDAIGSARLVVELSILVDFCAVVVSALI